MYEHTGGTELQDCHVLYSNRSRNAVNKIYEAKTQDHLRTHQAIEKFVETWNNAVDYRVPGIPLSAVEQQDTTRKNMVKKLIEKFENHQHKKSFLQDLSQTQKINKFSKESQELIADMTNTRSSNFAKILPNSNVLSAMPTGKPV